MIINAIWYGFLAAISITTCGLSLIAIVGIVLFIDGVINSFSNKK